MLKQLCMIKKILANTRYKPLSDSDRIDFRFTKPGYKKLLIFDLDETLIHVKRTFEADEMEDNVSEDFEPDVHIPVYDPHTKDFINASFSVRPFARKCLSFANKHFEIAIFTASSQWFANPILDYLDPEGTLI